jgi:hypothetical protein
MSKKIIMACMAVFALAAFALPATASATNDPTLTEGATHVAVNSKIVGTSFGETLFVETTPNQGNVLVRCTTAHLTGEVKANSGGTVEGTISSAKFSGTGSVHADNGLNECTGAFGNAYITVTNLPLCIRSTPTMATDEFQVVSSDCGGAEPKNVKFLIGSTTIGECEYESTSSLKGDYTTSSTESTLSIRNTQAGSGSKKIRGGFLCPGSGQLNMTFHIETDVSPFTKIGVS